MTSRHRWLTGAICMVWLLQAAACPTPTPPPRRTPPRGGTTEPAGDVWQKVKSPDAKVRAEAAAELGQSGSDKALAALIELLRDADAGVSAAAEAALVKHGKAAAGLLVAGFKGADKAACDRHEAALLKIGKPAAPALMAGLGDVEAVAAHAAAVLKKLPNGVAVLSHVIERGASVAKARAASALAELGTRPAKLALLPALAVWDHTVRDTARTAVKPLFGDKDVTERILAMFKNATFWQAYALTLSVFDHPDTRVHNEIVFGFHTARTTYARHALFGSLVRRDKAWYGRVAGGVSHPSPRAREHILKALWFEVSSLQRIQVAAKQHRDKALADWSTAELAALKKALADKDVKASLAQHTKKLKPYMAQHAAFLLKYAGGRANPNAVRKKYVAGLQKLLEQPPEKVGVDTILAAYVHLGDDAWKRSCPVPEVEGLCLQIKYRKAKGAWTRTIRFRKRNAKLVKYAMAMNKKAWLFWADGAMLDRIPKTDPKHKARRMRARHFAAWARFMRSEYQLEKYLQIDLPKNLDFTKKRAKKSAAAFKAWLLKKSGAAKALLEGYQSVITGVNVKQPGYERASTYWALAAISRVAMVYDKFADALLGVPAPRNLRTAAQRDAFFAALDKEAQPYLTNAKDSYQLCVDTTRKVQWHWEFGLSCERALSRLDPAAFEKHAKQKRYTRAPLPGPGYPHQKMVDVWVQLNAKQLQACNYPRKGRFGYKVTLEPTGTVSAIKAAGRKKLPSAADQCVIKVLQSMRLGPFRDKAATVTVTLP